MKTFEEFLNEANDILPIYVLKGNKDMNGIKLSRLFIPQKERYVVISGQAMNRDTEISGVSVSLLMKNDDGTFSRTGQGAFVTMDMLKKTNKHLYPIHTNKRKSMFDREYYEVK